LIKFIKKENQT